MERGNPKLESSKNISADKSMPVFVPDVIPLEIPRTLGDVARAKRDVGPGLPHALLTELHDIAPTTHDK